MMGIVRGEAAGCWLSVVGWTASVSGTVLVVEAALVAGVVRQRGPCGGSRACMATWRP